MKICQRLHIWKVNFILGIFPLFALIAIDVAADQMPISLNMPTVLNVPVTQGQTSAEVILPVSSSDSMRLQVIVPVDNADLTLSDPFGAVVLTSSDPAVSFLDGSLLPQPLPGGVFLTPILASPADGNWNLRLEFPPAAESTVILASLYLQTSYQVGIVLERTEYRAGQSASVGMIVVEAGVPITGLTPTITLTTPSGSQSNHVGVDDGSPANFDGLANDGIYSFGYTFANTGTYLIEGEVSIPTASGAVAQRYTQSVVTVSDPLLNITSVDGSLTTDVTGCVAGAALHVEADSALAGTFVASAILSGTNSQTVETSLSRELTTPGQLTFDLNFSSDVIREGIGVDGPYVVNALDILSFQSTGVNLEVRELDAFTFESLALSDLCIPPIAITRNLTVGQSLRDGYIDALSFAFPVTVAASDGYQISFKVTDANGRDVELFGFFQRLNAGLNTVEVSVPFDKFQSSDGPYTLESVLVLGHGASAQESVVGSSDALSQWQFYPRITGDLDADGDVDADDRAVILGFRGEQALTPGDRRDLTGDGIIDLRDARYIIGLVCPSGSCPLN
ncbi:MAG: hypothetical protein PVI92_12150 [Chromatiales bacterium]|jgi:hypothetical protein